MRVPDRRQFGKGPIENGVQGVLVRQDTKVGVGGADGDVSRPEHYLPSHDFDNPQLTADVHFGNHAHPFSHSPEGLAKREVRGL